MEKIKILFGAVIIMLFLSSCVKEYTIEILSNSEMVNVKSINNYNKGDTVVVYYKPMDSTYSIANNVYFYGETDTLIQLKRKTIYHKALVKN